MRGPLSEHRIIEGLKQAEKIAKSSQSPYTKVGCVLLSSNGEVQAYGFNHPDCTVLRGFWDMDREYLRDYLVHAEIDALANFGHYLERDNPSYPTVAVCTLMPCVSCLNSLARFGIKQIYFKEKLDRDAKAMVVAEYKGILMVHMSEEWMIMAEAP